MLNPHHFYKEFKGISVDLFNHLVDHFDILWFWLTLLHVGHTCACCPQGTLHSPNCWLRLSSSGLTTLIIRSNLFDWIMLENSHLKLLMTIACRLGLKLNIQNGLAEAFIKRLQMIGRSLVIRTKLPIAAWGHAILHAAKLVRLRPVATQPFSALQLVTG